MLIYPATAENLQKAGDFLREGSLVALPTETVYGLAADGTNDRAIAKIYEAKRRPSFNPLIIHFPEIDSLKPHVEWNEQAQALADAFWPGPLTLVLSKKTDSPISSLASAGLSTVAVRIPQHPVALEVLKRAGLPLAAPSANPSESLSPTCAQHVAEFFPHEPRLSMILEGGSCTCGLESTIVDLSTGTPTLLRPGALTLEKIEALIGPLKKSSSPTEKPLSPGQTPRHYAPRHPLRLHAQSVGPREGLLAFGPDVLPGAAYTANLSVRGDLEEAAARFFALLHYLDSQDIEALAVMPIPEIGLGVAINDRLRRAAFQK